jgi:integrase
MLTDTEIRNAKFNEPDKAKGKPPGSLKTNKRSDGGGLYIEITANGSKLWRIAYRFQAKQRTLYIQGAYPAVTLVAARTVRDNAKVLLARGIDPSAHKKEIIREASMKLSFAMLANKWFEEKIKKEGKADCTIETIERCKDILTAALGHLDADSVEPSHVVAAIQPTEDAGHYHSAQRVRSAASRIFKYGRSKGHCKFNPAADLGEGMIKKAATKRPAILLPAKFGKLLRDIEAYNGKFENVTQLALKLLPLVVTRPYAELGKAEWNEFDFDNARWIVPSSRMKKREGEHWVPLSRQALTILKQLDNITGNHRFVFALNRDQPIAKTTIGAALIAMGYQGQHCAHGFRSSFSSMVNSEYRGADENEKVWHSDVVELQLAHLEGSTREIYFRRGPDALWKQRSNLMQHWADRCDAMRGDNVKQIGRAA